MKVTFVYPDQVEVDPSWSGHFYYGVGILSSYLKRAGIETSLIHIIKAGYTEAAFELDLQREKPDLIAFSCTTFGFTLAKRFVKIAKRTMPEVPTICGGIHPTFAPGKAILTEGLDMVCLGEGEESMLELCKRLSDGEEYLDIPNIWVNRNGIVHKNDVRPVNQDLDS